jgi:hypothetical protein
MTENIETAMSFAVQFRPGPQSVSRQLPAKEGDAERKIAQTINIR